jgi:hypothetical protein
MKMKRSKWPILFCASATLGLALAARSAHAQTQNTVWRMTEHLGAIAPISGGEFWRSGNYVDFLATSSDPNRTFKTWNVSPIGQTTVIVPYASVVIYGNGAGNVGNSPECFEIYTEQANAQTINADTRMFLYDPDHGSHNPGALTPQGDTAYSSVSDDWGGTYYSRLRVFWGGATSGLSLISVRVAPFGASSSTIDFGVTWRRLNYTTADDCHTKGLSAATNFVDASKQTQYLMSTSY